MDLPNQPVRRSWSRSQRGHLRKLVPFPAIQRSSSGFWPQTAPLLEKECDSLDFALLTDTTYPIGVHGARAWATFAANDDPVDAGQVNFAKWTDKWFD